MHVRPNDPVIHAEVAGIPCRFVAGRWFHPVPIIQSILRKRTAAWWKYTFYNRVPPRSRVWIAAHEAIEPLGGVILTPPPLPSADDEPEPGVIY